MSRSRSFSRQLDLGFAAIGRSGYCNRSRPSLDPKIAQLDGVSFLKKDAFSTKPEELYGVDWVFCDVVCFPEKLLSWIQKCSALHPRINFVCTIKFQGKANRSIIEQFETINGSCCLHLFHNKHELTWFKFNS